MKKTLIFPAVLLLLLIGLAARDFIPPGSPPGSTNADQIAVHGKVEIWSLDQANSETDYYFEEENDANIAGGHYIPARNIFITQEFEGLVSDPEGFTDQYGYYYLKKSGLVEDSNYDVNLEVRAEAILGTYGNQLWPNEVTVQVFQDSTDIYEVNGETPAYSYHTGTDNEVNIKIGGPQDSGITWDDDVYCDWTLSDCNGYQGEDDNMGIHPVVAFWMTQVLQDFVKQVTRLAPNLDQINNDTWIIYPAMNDSTHYAAYAPPPGIGSIDISDEPLFPSQFDGAAAFSNTLGSNWRSFRQTLFHEYSHKIMHDVYWFMPEPNVNDWQHIGESEHNLETCTSKELAWKEGFAEFLPAAIAGVPLVSGQAGNGNIEYSYYPPEYLDKEGYIQDTPVSNDPNVIYPNDHGTITWHYNVTRTCDERRKNEGEVAAVLWDIYDPKGWEYLNAAAQPVFVSWKRPIMFYDRLEDSGLSEIWDELRYNEPDSINDEGYDTVASEIFDWSRLDSFWTDWIHTTYPDDDEKIHGLKAILYNRGIPSVLKPEHPPKLEDVSVDVSGRKLTFRVSEPDVEDRPSLYFNVGYMKDRTDSEYSYYYSEDRPVSELATNWRDGQLTVTLDIPRGKLGRDNGVMLHDSMLVDLRSRGVTQNEKHFNLWCAPASPSNFASSVAVQGNYAYVADMEDGLYIFDLSDPLKPVKQALLQGDMSSADAPWGGAMGVAVRGNYAYVAAYSGALVVVDISKPASPRLAAYLELEGDPRSVALGDMKAYVANGTGGMAVVNIRYPESPGLETTLATGGGLELVVSGNEAYLGTEGGLEIYSLGVFPRQKGFIPTPGEAVSGVAVDGDGLIYLVTREGSLKVYDVSTWNPALADLQPFMIEKADPELISPILLAELPVHVLSGGAVLDGDSLYAGGVVVDVGEPELVYAMADNMHLAGASDLAVKDGVVYAAAGTDGLLVFSSSTSTAAQDACGAGDTLQGGNEILEPAGVWEGHVNDMAFAGGHGYLATGEEGMKIVSVRPPGTIQDKGVYQQWLGPDQFKLDARGVEVSQDGDLVYLSSFKGDLQILNITSPASPSMMGMVQPNRHEDAGQWSDVAATDLYAYVCAGTGGLRGLDLRDVSDPPWRDTANLALNDCTDVAVHLPFVYALGSSSGLHIFELMVQDSNSMPDLYEVGVWKLPEGISGSAYSSLYLDLERRLLYVSSLWNGITILDVYDPPHPAVLSSIDPGRAYGLALSDNTLFAGDEQVVHIIDVGDPTKPRETGSQELTDRYGLEISAINLKVYEGVLYVVTDRDTLQAYRILK